MRDPWARTLKRWVLLDVWAKGLARSTKRSSWRRTTICASACLSYCASRVICLGWNAGRTRALRACSGRRSSLRVSRAPSLSNCACPRVLPGYCAIKAIPPMQRHFSSLSSPSLPKGSRRLTSKRRRRFWTIFADSRSRLAFYPRGIGFIRAPNSDGGVNGEAPQCLYRISQPRLTIILQCQRASARRRPDLQLFASDNAPNLTN